MGMKALVYDGVDDFTVRDIPKPEIQEPTDVIVEVDCALSSGTDAHVFEDSNLDAAVEGRVFGADFAGTVAETGASIERFEPGDRVVPGVMTHCDDCFYCERELWAHCENGGWLLGYEIDGGRANYARIPLADKNLYHVPDSVTFEEVVLAMAGLPTGYEGAERGDIQPGDSVAIIGAGAIGLCALECVKLWGPAEIVVVDRIDTRMDVAETMGADRTIDGTETDPRDALESLNDGHGPDVVIEAGGNEATYQMALDSVQIGGTVSLIAYHHDTYDIPFGDVWDKNLDVRFGYVNADQIPKLVDLIDKGRIELEPILNNEIRLSDVDGIDDLVGPDILKTIIYP